MTETGDQTLTVRDNRTGRQWTEGTHWLFLCLGGTPHTQWAAEVGIVRDNEGRDAIAAGQVLSDEQFLKMNWLAVGVQGKLSH